jgi:hypothetical protein
MPLTDRASGTLIAALAAGGDRAEAEQVLGELTRKA